MHKDVQFEDENDRGKKIFITALRYILWAVMIGIAVYLASHGLTAEGKEPEPQTETSEEAYRKAVQKAVFCQKNFMEYMGVPKKQQSWFSVQMYRLAYLKEIRRKQDQQQNSREQKSSLYWCNKLGGLTMEAYEKLDDKGKLLLNEWQLSREQWKKEEDKRQQGENTQPEYGMEFRERINRLYYQQLNCILNTQKTEKGEGGFYE